MGIIEGSVIAGIETEDKGIMWAVLKNRRVFCRRKICLCSVFPEGRTKITGIKHQNIKKHYFDKIEGSFFFLKTILVATQWWALLYYRKFSPGMRHWPKWAPWASAQQFCNCVLKINAQPFKQFVLPSNRPPMCSKQRAQNLWSIFSKMVFKNILKLRPNTWKARDFT